MERIIVRIYQAMAKVLSLPAGFFINSRMVDYGISFFLLMAGLVFLILALKKNYKTPLKHFLGCGLGVLILGFHGINQGKVDPEAFFHPYVIYGLGVFLLLMVMVFVENFIVSWNNGSSTLLLWVGDVILTVFAIRVWQQCSDMGKSGFQYKKLYPLETVLDRYDAFMLAHNFKPIILLGEWIGILFLLAITAFILGNVRKLLSADYKTISGALMLSTFVYMIFQVHDAYSWSAFYKGMTYGLAVVAQMTLLYLFIYVPKSIIGGKDVKAKNIVVRVVAMVEVLFVGICMNLASLFAVDLVATGAMNKLLGPLAAGMSWFYKHLKELNYGYQTNFLSETYRVYFGFFVAAFLIYLVVLILFLIMKLVLGDLTCEGVALPWLRNCILILVIPTGLYWFYSMCGDRLGETGVWILNLIQVVALMGLMTLIGNFIPAIKKKGTMTLVKWTLVSMVVCTLAVFALLPALMIFA